MYALTPSQLDALHGLVRKKAGAEVGFISIADARALTELGLARRAPIGGWEVTPEGEALISDQGAPNLKS